MSTLAVTQLTVCIVLLALLPVTRWLLTESRQRSALLLLGLLGALYAGTANLLWQGAPLLAPLSMLLTVLLAWALMRLLIAVRQVELRRRWLLRVSDLLCVALAVVAGFVEQAWLDPTSTAPLWLDQPLFRAALGLTAGFCLLALLEALLGLFASVDEVPVWPWLLVVPLLTGGLALDLAAASLLAPALQLQPWGCLGVLFAVFIALLSSWRFAGPFPLQGELPRAVFLKGREPLLLLDGAQRIQGVTDSALDLLDMSRAQIIGQPLQRILPSAPVGGEVWEGPLWLADKQREDGGLWLQSSQISDAREQIIARMVQLRSGASHPPERVNTYRSGKAPDLLEGPEVWPALQRVIRKYGHGRRALAASLHVSYDWGRVQTEHGEAVMQGLLKALGERLLKVCDWSVDCYRLGDGQFILLLTDMTSPEEVEDLLGRAQIVLAEPFVLARKRWELKLRMAEVPDLRYYRTVDEWLQAAGEAMKQSRGQFVSTQAQAQQNNRLFLGLEEAVANNGLDWFYTPILNLTTLQVAGWHVVPRWTPEPGVEWAGEALNNAIASLHVQKAFYALYLPLLEKWQSPLWLHIPQVDLSLALKGLGQKSIEFMLELDGLDNELLREQGLRVAPSANSYVAPVDGGRGFGHPLHPRVLRLDSYLALPGLADDPARQALIKGCRGAARARKQRLYAAGVQNRVDLSTLREVGVDYASGPVVGGMLSLESARIFKFKQ